MKQIIASIFIVFFFGACKTIKVPDQNTHQSEDCKEYFNFLKENWLQVDSFYQFKGEPKYWLNYPKYGKFECLMSLSREELRTLLGEPTKIFILPKVEIWIYCMNEECTVELLHYKNAKEWIFNFNKEGPLETIFFNPTF